MLVHAITEKNATLIDLVLRNCFCCKRTGDFIKIEIIKKISLFFCIS